MKTIPIIPSKSAAHRALICGALSETPCRIICENRSKDVEATRICLKALREGKEEMYCGESGSTLRFLLPVLAAKNYRAKFYPEGRLAQRPLSPLYEEMQNHGCVLSPLGSVPFEVKGQLKPGAYHIAGNVSSQYISGLLMALTLLEGDSEIIIEGKLESAPYVELTCRILKDFGIHIEETENGYLVPGSQKYRGPETYTVEGDWSNGAVWLAAGVLSKEGLAVSGLDTDSSQGDREICNLLKAMGAEVTADESVVSVKGGSLRAMTINASQIPDLIPAIAVAALAAEGETVITGAQRLRLKESDRIEAIVSVINALGGQAEERPDGLKIKGGIPLTGGIVETYHDHRIVMMAAIASLLCREKVIIKDAEAVEKSYPDFFGRLTEAGLDWNIERK